MNPKGCVGGGGGGGGGTSLLGLYRPMPLDRVWFFGLSVQFDFPLS